MITANISIGWVNKSFEGNSASEVIDKVSEYQDFGCLLVMARQNESKRGQKEADKLECFLEKYNRRELTVSDLGNLKIHLSIGDIICSEVNEV